MLSGLEALLALEREGTMTRAASRLRITQSAVSKRIAALAAELDVVLTERDGRRVRLTPAATRLVDRARPLLTELRGALAGERADAGGLITVGVSESILASWGAPALARAMSRAPSVEVRIAAHRSPVTIERVRAGEYMLALCAGRIAPAPDLVTALHMDEPMTLVPSSLRRLRVRRGRTVPVIGIERGSATGRAIATGLRRLRRDAGVRIEVEREVGSYACIVQMARAGLGHGLVPRAVAEAAGLPSRALAAIPGPGLTRPVALVGRPGTLARPIVAEFVGALARVHPALRPA